MSEQKLKPFFQIPTWEKDAQITITGEEFLKLKEVFDIFAQPVYIMETIFRRNLNTGTIKIKYEDEEGNEMSEDEVRAIHEEVQKRQKSETPS